MENLVVRLVYFPRSTSGISAAEYALILGIVVVGIAGAGATFGSTLAAVLGDLANCAKAGCS